MKKQLLYILLVLLVMGTSLVFAEETSSPKKRKPAVFESKTTLVTATVTAIDYKKRFMTLQGQDGLTQQIELAQEVKNIKQIKAGDSVSIDVLETMAVFIEKDAGKKLRKQSFETIKVALPNQKTMQTRVKIEEMTASIESIDLEKRLIVLKFPHSGKQTYFVPRATKNLDKLKTDDQILFRYTKSKGLTLVKNRNTESTNVPTSAPASSQPQVTTTSSK